VSEPHDIILEGCVIYHYDPQFQPQRGGVIVTITPGGSVSYTDTRTRGGIRNQVGSVYLHVADGCPMPEHVTDAQRRVLAEVYLSSYDNHPPFWPQWGNLGASALRLGLAGLSPDDISSRYGSGERVFCA